MLALYVMKRGKEVYIKRRSLLKYLGIGSVAAVSGVTIAGEGDYFDADSMKKLAIEFSKDFRTAKQAAASNEFLEWKEGVRYVYGETITSSDGKQHRVVYDA